jgi:hypothetical protein
MKIRPSYLSLKPRMEAPPSGDSKLRNQCCQKSRLFRKFEVGWYVSLGGVLEHIDPLCCFCKGGVIRSISLATPLLPVESLGCLVPYCNRHE